MDLSKFSFFNPAPDFREMGILRMISQKPTVSQGELAKKTGIVPSMVNKYIYEFEKNELLLKEGENRRKMSYKLTENGKVRLQFLTVSYLNEISKLYSQSHDIFNEVILEIKKHHIKRLYLYGAGIIGGILAEVLQFENYQILGYIDEAKEKIGRDFFEYQIFSPSQIDNEEYDGVIIASFENSLMMYDKAVGFGLKNIFCFKITEQGAVRLEKMEG